MMIKQQLSLFNYWFITLPPEEDLPPLEGALPLEDGDEEEEPEPTDELLGVDQLDEEEGDSKVLEGDALLEVLLILSALLISDEVLG
jgi:hypothetical protein